ncbi:MAG: dihydrofolate reductase [Burkholderiaceae bacterium]
MDTLPAGISVSLIVARADNNVIGRDNDLVWKIPEELQHFKSATMGHAIVMGRKTWSSIGRPLPGRRMIVMSSDPEFRATGCENASDLTDAFKLAVTPTEQYRSPPAEVFVAGGAHVYRQTVSIANRILLTQIALSPEGDVTFDWQPDEQWHCVTREPAMSRAGIAYEIQDWRRHQ